MDPIVFNVGDKVRFIGGTFVEQCPGKRVEYDMKGRTGIIKSRISFSKYKVEVDFDGVKHQIIASENDFQLQRIDTPFTDFLNRMNQLKDPKRFILSLDLGCDYAPLPKGGHEASDSKMTKERCIKLLESYRAERDKVQKGRKFERCLRFDVVNEALEKAIELLKEKP